MPYSPGRMNHRSYPSSAPALEHWRVEAEDNVAVLVIPGLNGRSRLFDIDVGLLVNVPAEADGAWLS